MWTSIKSISSLLLSFGMLLLAHHRGIASLGEIMVLGSGASLFGSVVILPAILTLLARR